MPPYIIGFMQPSDPKLKSLQSDFLRHLETERRMSPRTVASYQRDLTTLFAQMGDLALEALTPQHVRRFVAQLHARGRATWRAYLRKQHPRRGEYV